MQVTLRLELETLDRIDKLADKLEAELAQPITRAFAARYALQVGLVDLLEQPPRRTARKRQGRKAQ
jgi:hypothetical protein